MDLSPRSMAGQGRAGGRWPGRGKFVAALAAALLWTMFSIWVSTRWVEELGSLTHPWFALFAITFIAYVPGFMNMFLMASLVLDRRPPRRQPAEYPGVTVLIAAYNEADAIGETLRGVAEARYDGPLEVLVLDDGSGDGTAEVARRAAGELSFAPNVALRVLRLGRNAGKAAALNHGLSLAAHELIVTIDADTLLHSQALAHIVERFLCDGERTAAVAGAVLVRNAHETLMAGAQEWDYFHGIAAVKRMQSMYHGTLVAQGAFSIYDKRALREVGGWPECVGEDIVLTWALLKKGWRTGYAEDAIVFTNAPTTFRQFALQRKRWSRGLVEALHHHEGLLFKPRMSTMFIWWNLLFLPLDLAYSLIFIPGLIAALFGYFWIAGPLTLAVLPLAAMWNLLIYRIQSRMSERQQLELRHSRMGLVFYLVAYTVVMQPVCVWGYAAEIAGLTKKWGTK
jgi:poly-beta-1,6-N-acetyl-D-glucosamine synthase